MMGLILSGLLLLIPLPVLATDQGDGQTHGTTIELPANAPIWAGMVATGASIVMAYLKLKHEQKKDHQSVIAEQQAALDRQQTEWAEKLERQLEKKDEMILGLQGRIIEIEARYAVLEREFESYKLAKEAAIDRLRAESDKLQSQISDLQQLLKSERSENVRLTDRFNKVLIEKEMLEQRIKAYESQA